MTRVQEHLSGEALLSECQQRDDVTARSALYEVRGGLLRLWYSLANSTVKHGGWTLRFGTQSASLLSASWSETNKNLLMLLGSHAKGASHS